MFLHPTFDFVHQLGHGGVVAGAEDGADGVAGRRPCAAGQAAHAEDPAHFEGGCVSEEITSKISLSQLK